MKTRNAFISIFAILLFLLPSFLLCTFAAAEPDDYDKIGVEEGMKYEWTVKIVDMEIFEEEDPWGRIYVYLREDKKIVYEVDTVEKIKDEDTDELSWAICGEEWHLANEVGVDDGTDGIATIYSNVEDYIEYIDDFVDSECRPYNLELEMFFIPSDVKDYLEEVGENWDNYSGEGRLEVDKKDFLWINGEHNDFKCNFDYNDDGILERLSVKYKGETLYSIYLTDISSNDAYFWTVIFVIIGIIALVAIGVVIYFTKIR